MRLSPSNVGSAITRSVGALDALVAGAPDRGGVLIADPLLAGKGDAVEGGQQHAAALQCRRHMADKHDLRSIGAKDRGRLRPRHAVVGDAEAHLGDVPVAGDLGEPTIRTDRNPGEVHRNVGDALLGPAEPNAGEVTLGQEGEVGGLALHGRRGQERRGSAVDAGAKEPVECSHDSSNVIGGRRAWSPLMGSVAAVHRAVSSSSRRRRSPYSSESERKVRQWRSAESDRPGAA